ncbi:MAG: (Na+)-NQR maturation NqrM [Wenzhouxiangella sp.]|nr:(Na+)-NQR maturation NqrM [Wenzhouxiangella sp.]TVR97172.1 MAG: (Na+)-NQR maturation NqrM [Wenzhouxiangellaceae bacterium]
MLTTFILSAALMLVVVAAMAIGVIMGRKPISGSCGGLGSKAGCPCGRKPGDPCSKTSARY